MHFRGIDMYLTLVCVTRTGQQNRNVFKAGLSVLTVEVMIRLRFPPLHRRMWQLQRTAITTTPCVEELGNQFRCTVSSLPPPSLYLVYSTITVSLFWESVESEMISHRCDRASLLWKSASPSETRYADFHISMQERALTVRYEIAYDSVRA